jgi:hypothetical protein
MIFQSNSSETFSISFSISAIVDFNFALSFFKEFDLSFIQFSTLSDNSFAVSNLSSIFSNFSIILSNGENSI